MSVFGGAARRLATYQDGSHHGEQSRDAEVRSSQYGVAASASVSAAMREVVSVGACANVIVSVGECEREWECGHERDC